MKVNYLSADTHLSKIFEEIAPGVYKDTAYPHAARFTSIEKSFTDVKSFCLTTVACANEGLCLLKGVLDRPLINESRAGHTDATTPTSWVCLDVDFIVTDQTPEQFFVSLSPALKDVSFFFQLSASQGIKTYEGWRGHYFFFLDTPQPPQVLKQWLISLNLNNEQLQQHLDLTASGGALVYPLDVTTCQNDKLIYIAPPNCVNFEDPIKERFAYYEFKKSAALIDFSGLSAARLSEQTNQLIQKLRKEKELPEKKFTTTKVGTVEVLTNPDDITVTGKKEARDFVYLNLNGGDSWGYFFPVSNPDILFNFKGEPCLYMWDVDKDIYNEYADAPTSTENAVPFGFLWPDDDRYYRGFANPISKELVWLKPVGSKSKLKDFLVQNNAPPPSKWAVDEWQLEFDPTTDGYADFLTKTVNTFKKSKYLKRNGTATSIPPTIDRILNSVCVDTTTKMHFINWLACIFQTRTKTNTAWIFQGVQGTGKGILFTHVISPLLGREYCHEMTMDRMDDDFNAYLSENIILFIDEAKISDSRNGDRLLNRIKNLITEPEQHIRGMRQNAITRNNYSNIILASNYDDIIPLDVMDRRFNVAPRQEVPIHIEYADIKAIRSELEGMADYLNSYKASKDQARTVIMSDAREKLIKLSETTVDSFFFAIRNDDLSYFTQYLDSGLKGDSASIRYHDYALVVNKWIKSANTVTNIARSEIQICYEYLQNVSISTTKFSRMAAKYSIEIVPVKVDGKLTRGLRDKVWRLDDDERKLHEETESDNVVKLHK